MCSLDWKFQFVLLWVWGIYWTLHSQLQKPSTYLLPFSWFIWNSSLTGGFLSATFCQRKPGFGCVSLCRVTRLLILIIVDFEIDIWHDHKNLIRLYPSCKKWDSFPLKGAPDLSAMGTATRMFPFPIEPFPDMRMAYSCLYFCSNGNYLYWRDDKQHFSTIYLTNQNLSIRYKILSKI